VRAAARLGITVGTVAYSPDSVADHTLMLMLMAVRHAAQTVRRVDAGDFRLGERRGRELRDLTFGVVGTGRIGSAVIERLHGFGARVLSIDTRMPSPGDRMTLDELLERSDLVTLHVPLTAETHHLLDARRLARMRPDAVVVNTARGGLVDTEALAEALEGGRLGAAALDVVEGEEGVFYADRRTHPLESGPLARLRALPNALITPHAAFDTDHALRDIVEDTLRACLAHENGRPHG
jgi:D-specific alpha-keto acid dehydrogenase